ncbi:hypothetical protein EDB19DRAFT_2033285 [Suillus lakei]|nr:hypothetical protein EDB19DRAFT_2033285 [Suillus lakei]
MHVCLLPTEILLHVFALYKDRELSSRATLAALARTCRKFKEPALDILWKDITGFTPLISCLPGGVTKKKRGKLTFKRPLFDREWRFIDRYACRIRSFRVSDAELDIGNRFKLIQTLISARLPTPLLPNLRSLVWCDDREWSRFYPLLRTLLRPTITFLKLGYIISTPSSLALLASLGVQCPSIQELHCDIYDGGSEEYDGDSEEDGGSEECLDPEERLDAILEALCSLRKLFRLNAGYLTTQELLRLATLSSLKSLNFGLEEYYDDEMQHNTTPIIFSQLDQVHITAQSFSILYHCLTNVRFFLVDQYGPTDLYDPLDIPGLIVSLSECFSPVLEKLHFHFHFNFNSNFFTSTNFNTLADPSFALGFDVIAPLLSFSRLTDLRLDWICTSAIDDASLRTIAQSWPQLETFCFGSAARWVIPPSLTFIGLVHLIHHCPRLRTIGMPFRACQVDINSEPLSQTIPNENITELFVGMSPIVDPSAVASQLRRLMPKLTYVDFFDWLDYDISMPPPFENLEDGWDRVNEFLKD